MTSVHPLKKKYNLDNFTTQLTNIFTDKCMQTHKCVYNIIVIILLSLKYGLLLNAQTSIYFKLKYTLM